MGFACHSKLILIAFFVPWVLGQRFQPLVYRVVNGNFYKDPPTTTQATFLETYFPFLASSYSSSNSESIDEEILNSVTGPPSTASPLASQNPDSGVLSLPGFSQYPQQQGMPPNQYAQPGMPPQYPYQGMPPQYPYPGMPPQYPYPGMSPQYQSPYLTNDEDVYLSSGSINSPQQTQPDGSASQNLPNYAANPNYIPGSVNPVPQPYYSTNHYASLEPGPISSMSQLPYPLSGMNLQDLQASITEKPAPFYQPILDFFGFGSSSSDSGSPFGSSSSFPSNIFSSGSISSSNPFSSSSFSSSNPFSDLGNSFQLPPQFAQARKSTVEGNNNEDSIIEQAPLDDNNNFQSLNDAIIAKDSSNTSEVKEDKFPCPNLGFWQWDGEYCIAVGPVPAWGCRPNDLVMSGRLGVCRNKFFLPTSSLVK